MHAIFEKTGFSPADILLPKGVDMKKWAAIAVDQHTSEESYWRELESFVGEAPSTLKLTLPEYYLGKAEEEEKLQSIGETMKAYLENGVYDEYKESFIYVEREQSSGKIRKGILGKFDLEKYDFTPGSGTMIRATEETVRSRIPPRVKIREKAVMEFPHVLILCDDRENILFSAAGKAAEGKPYAYDFRLYGSDQSLKGRVIPAEEADGIRAALEKLASENGFFFAVGDGNHSLATAKACYEKRKAEGAGEEELLKARYALAELVNIEDDAMPFEPIHRVAFTSLENLKKAAEAEEGEEEYTYKVYAGEKTESLTVRGKKDLLPVAVLQAFLDKAGFELDYIHDEEALISVASEKSACGILLPSPERSLLFSSVASLGVLPRKTFSLGRAEDKRFYVEGRLIK